MNKYLLSMVALSALAAASAPAHAQYASRYPGYADEHRSGTPGQLLERLATRLDESVRTGAIAEYAAAPLRADIRQLRDLEYRFGRDGLSSWERRDLSARIDSLRGRILAAERTRYGRGEGFDADRNFGNLDRGDEPFFGAEDGWDDSAYSGAELGYDDRWSDPYSTDGIEPAWQDPQTGDFDEGQGLGADGSWQDEDDSDFDPTETDDSGWGDDGLSLNVGDHAPADLGPVPDQYRSRYRDGGGVYYRHSRGTIYQIDSSTNLIRWMGILPG